MTKQSPLILVLLTGFLSTIGLVGPIAADALAPLTQRKIIPPPIAAYLQQAQLDYYHYSAIHVFDQGFTKLQGPQLYTQLQIYQGAGSLKNGHPTNTSPETIIKLLLPEGFQHGVLQLKTTASSNFTVKLSNDLNTWQSLSYPYYARQATIPIPTNQATYLKFDPAELSIYIDELHYTSRFSTYNAAGFSEAVLFYPDVDVDRDGTITKLPAIIYGQYKTNQNL